jgi:CarD family transcriptional regulator
MSTSKMNFEKGESVIYPNHGICVIEQIKKETIGGISDTFYNVRVIETGSSLFIPSNNLQTVGLRLPIKKSEVKKIYHQIESGDINIYSKWKNRYEENLKMMGTGTIENIVDVLKSLFFVAYNKTLSFREKKMQERAMDLLASEIAHTTRDEKSKVEADLIAKFEKAVEQYLKEHE